MPNSFSFFATLATLAAIATLATLAALATVCGFIGHLLFSMFSVYTKSIDLSRGFRTSFQNSFCAVCQQSCNVGCVRDPSNYLFNLKTKSLRPQ